MYPTPTRRTPDSSGGSAPRLAEPPDPPAASSCGGQDIRLVDPLPFPPPFPSAFLTRQAGRGARPPYHQGAQESPLQRLPPGHLRRQAWRQYPNSPPTAAHSVATGARQRAPAVTSARVPLAAAGEYAGPLLARVARCENRQDPPLGRTTR